MSVIYCTRFVMRLLYKQGTNTIDCDWFIILLATYFDMSMPRHYYCLPIAVKHWFYLILKSLFCQ
jgi:hypothetical protein